VVDWKGFGRWQVNDASSVNLRGRRLKVLRKSQG
jgi:hypothetical protein